MFGASLCCSLRQAFRSSSCKANKQVCILAVLLAAWMMTMITRSKGRGEREGMLIRHKQAHVPLRVVSGPPNRSVLELLLFRLQKGANELRLAF